MQAIETTNKPRLESIFNIGVKAPDIEKELAFFKAFRPKKIYKVSFGPKQIDAIEIGGVRFFIFSSFSYDESLPAPHPGGIGHISFMVDSLDELLASLEQKGIQPFRGPYEGQLGDLGKRMVAMFRSPNGTLISVIPRN